jgi:hypothetical protein
VNKEKSIEYAVQIVSAMISSGQYEMVSKLTNEDYAILFKNKNDNISVKIQTLVSVIARDIARVDEDDRTITRNKE